MWNNEEPEHERARGVLARAMAEAGAPPAFVYAFHRTGLCPHPHISDELTPAQQKQWDAAIREYTALVARQAN